MAQSGVTLACQGSGKLASTIDWVASDDTNSCDVFNKYQYDDDDNYYYNNWDQPKEPQMTLDEMYHGLRKVITSVLSNRDSWPFKEPVDENIAPMYYEVIHQPIDLSVIEKKIEDRIYVDFHEVEKDFRLLVNNCETYNGPRNGYTILSYAVWRVFKRAVKRFLNADLSFDEQVAFIYPPPPKPNSVTTKAAIEARRKRRKHRKLKALEILAKAAEEAVKYTTIRGTGQESDGNSPHSSPSSKNGDEKFANKTNGHVLSFSIDSFSDCDSNSHLAFPSNLTLNLNIGMTEENLTFKTLSEWSEYIRLRGESVKLPQNSVILPHQLPNSKINGVSQVRGPEERHFKAVSSERLTIYACSGTINDDRANWSYHSDSSISESPPANETKRLILKLSRCNGDTGTVWKPVQIGEGIACPNNNHSNTAIEEQPSITKNINREHRNSTSEDPSLTNPKKRLALEQNVSKNHHPHHHHSIPFNTQVAPNEVNHFDACDLLNISSTNGHIIEKQEERFISLSEDSSSSSNMDCDNDIPSYNRVPMGLPS